MIILKLIPSAACLIIAACVAPDGHWGRWLIAALALLIICFGGDIDSDDLDFGGDD